MDSQSVIRGYCALIHFLEMPRKWPKSISLRSFLFGLFRIPPCIDVTIEPHYSFCADELDNKFNYNIYNSLYKLIFKAAFLP